MLKRTLGKGFRGKTWMFTTILALICACCENARHISRDETENIMQNAATTDDEIYATSSRNANIKLWKYLHQEEAAAARSLFHGSELFLRCEIAKGFAADARAAPPKIDYHAKRVHGFWK